MKLRQATVADLETLTHIEQSGDVHWGEKGLERALEDSDILLLVAEDENNTIAGYIAALIVADEMQVQNIVVDTGYRRNGVAMMLFEEASKRAQARGAQEVFLEVAVNNSAALALYEKLGFQRAGTRPDFYRDGSDATTMQKKM